MYSSQKDRNISNILGKKAWPSVKMYTRNEAQKSSHCLFNVTVSRDRDRQLLMWKERAWLWDDPLIVFKLSAASWLLTLDYTLSQGIAETLSFCMSMGKPLANISEVNRILWQICTRVTEGVSNPLTNSSMGIGNWCKYCSTYLSEGCQCLLVICPGVWISLCRSFQRISHNL
jgi:hypothetical protein